MYIIPYPQEHKIREEILNTKGFCVKSDLEFTACLDNGGETQIVFKITDCLRFVDKIFDGFFDAFTSDKG